MPRYKKREAVKRIAGTFRKDRAKRRVKIGRLSAVPPAPDFISELARAEWQRLAPLICEQRTLAAADVRGLALLCESLATCTQAQAVIASKGLTIVSDGKIRAHPAVKILEAARAQATRLLIEYGCTPRARAHVEPASDATPDNPFARLK